MTENLDALTRSDIEEDLESETVFLFLEDVPNRRSHYRDPGCLPFLSTGKPDIKSLFRFNLKDVSARHYGKS